MTAIPTAIPVTTIPVAVAPAHATLVVIDNDGTVPVRVATSEASDADNGRGIAPGTQADLIPGGRTSTARLVADEPTTVTVTRYDVVDIREEAAERTGLPARYIHGRTREEIQDSVDRLLASVAAEAATA